MTLAQKIADIKTLLNKLEDGWKTKTIFTNDDALYDYPDGLTNELEGGEACHGWSTIIYHLSDLVGFEDIGVDDSGKRSYLNNCFFTEQELWNLMNEARGFLELMKIPPAKKRAKRIKIS